MPGSAPRASLNNPYGPLVTFRTEDVLPPSALYISMNDTFVALFSVSLYFTAFTLSVRILMPDGTIQNETYVSTAPINPAVPSIVLPPVEGYLLSCVVERNDIQNCSAFCNMSLYRGAAQNPLVSLPPNAGMTVAAGYVSELGPLCWPNSPVIEPGTGAGYMRSVPLPNPTGANWTIRTTSQQRWAIVTVVFNFDTSAAAGNRQVTLVVLDQSGAGVARYSCGKLQAPSLAYSYNFFSGAQDALLGTAFVEHPIPDGLMLDPGMGLESVVLGIDAADTFTNGSLLVREWMGVGHG